MSDELKPNSERAHKRAVGKIRRAALIKRREAYFDLLASGYSVEQIASDTKTSPSAVRRAVGQGLGEATARCARKLCPPPGRAADQGAALRRRFARGGRSEGDCAVCKSRAGAQSLKRRQSRPDANRAWGTARNRADIAAACAHAFAKRGRYRLVRGRKELRKRAGKLLKSFAGINLCAGPSLSSGQSDPGILPGSDSGLPKCLPIGSDGRGSPPS
jgi:hypothetical protein